MLLYIIVAGDDKRVKFKFGIQGILLSHRVTKDDRLVVCGVEIV